MVITGNGYGWPLGVTTGGELFCMPPKPKQGYGMISYLSVIYIIELIILTQVNIDQKDSPVITISAIFLGCFCTYMECGLSPLLVVPTFIATLVSSLIAVCYDRLRY